MFNIITAAKRNPNGTFDAEVAITLYGRDTTIIASTEQRTVSKGHKSRDEATAAAIRWVRVNMFPVVQKLPKAKP